MHAWTCRNCRFTNFHNKTVCYNCAQKRIATKVKIQVDRNQLKMRLR